MKLEYRTDEHGQEGLYSVDGNHQVMMEWEQEYMKKCIEVLEPYGDVLEIGFGMAYSADKIQSYNIKSHTIIECNPLVLKRLEEYKKTHPNVIIVQGRWQDVLESCGKFDCVFFDDYPVQDKNDSTRFLKFLMDVLNNHSKKNTRISVYSTTNCSYLKNCPNISLTVNEFKVDIPEHCKYAKGDTMYTVLIKQKDILQEKLIELVDEPFDPLKNFNLALEYHKYNQTAIALSYYLRCAEFTDNKIISSESLLRASLCVNTQRGRDEKELYLIKHAITASPNSIEPYYIASLFYSWRSGNIPEKRFWLDSYQYACLGVNIIENGCKSEPFMTNFGYTEYNIYFQKAFAGSNIGKIDEAREIYTKILSTYQLDINTKNYINSKLQQLPEKINKSLVDKKSNNIPNNIFLSWETGIDTISQEMLNFINSWKKHNNNYKINFYDSNERYNFIKDNFDFDVVDAYNRLKPGAFKCDLWRYCILYIYGGFYADIDTLCLSCLDVIKEKNVDFICPIDLNPNIGCQYNLSNGFIGCIPKHPILKMCIDHIVNSIKQAKPSDKVIITNISGPGCLGININKYLNREWNTSFVGKEGIVNDIKLLKFNKDDECIYDISNNINILQNKNGNHELQIAYKNECSKLNNFICYGKYGNYTQINNVVDYKKQDINKEHIFRRAKNITTINNYHNNNSARFYLYENDLGPSACLKRGFRWEEHQHDIIDKFLNKETTAIEIGSHIGSITIKLAKVCKEVYAFEPIVESYNILKDNLQLNNCNNVILHNLGCGEKNKKVAVKWLSENNPGGTGLVGGILTKQSNIDDEIIVEIIRLDSIKFNKVDYIKIDVEGYEELVIKGAEETIKKYKPLIIMECFNKDEFNNNNLNAKKASYTEICERFKFLIDLGYTFKHIAFEDFLFLPQKNIEILEIKKNISNVKQNLIVIDNFYEDPDKIREYALSLNYQQPENHGAVGYRCESGRKILDGTKELFEKLLYANIPEGTNIGEWNYSTNGCFQWCNASVPIVYHCDSQKYAGIIYLTPDAPPECGTSFFRHKKYKLRNSEVFSKSDWYQSDLNYKEPHLDKTQWEVVDSIGNVYNRLVIFDAQYIHGVTEYFGEDIHNSRLFQLFFFDITK